MIKLQCCQLDLAQGLLVLNVTPFDFDDFAHQGAVLIQALPATLIEYQLDGDLHSWLVDFEGCQFVLRAELYTESVWFEALHQGRDELSYLAALFSPALMLPIASQSD